jgi:hypothetical protein
MRARPLLPDPIFKHHWPFACFEKRSCWLFGPTVDKAGGFIRVSNTDNEGWLLGSGFEARVVTSSNLFANLPN